MALEKSGVELVAESSSAFFATLDKGDAALDAFTQASGDAAARVTALGQAANAIKLGSLQNTIENQRTQLGLLNQQLTATQEKYGETSLQAQSAAARLDSLTRSLALNEQRLQLYNAQLAGGVPIANRFNQALQLIEAGAQKAGGFFVGLAQTAGGFLAANVIGAITAQVTDFFGSIVSESDDASAGQAQLRAVLTSTAGAAGVTATAANDLAGSLQDVTKFTDDQVLSAENMLLTFTKVSSAVFPEATETALDMATALKMSADSAGLLVGKALSSAEGVTGLRRAGVQFSDAQEVLIKNLFETGRTADAQRMVLAELQREFGGSARAAGETFGGQLAILSHHLDDVKQHLGDELLPTLIETVQWFDQNGVPALSRFVDGLIGLAEGGQQAIDFFIQVGSVINDQAVPALTALTVATAAYGVASGLAAIGGVQNLGLALVLLGSQAATAAGGIAAAAAATAAAVLPYALLAAAVYGVVKAWQDYQAQIESVTQRVLTSNEVWNRGTKALEDYTKASAFAKSQTGEQAAKLEELRARQHDQVATLAEHTALYEQFGIASHQSAESLQAEKDAINALGVEIDAATGALENNLATYDEAHLHSTDAIEDLRSQRAAHGSLAPAVNLTTDEVQKLSAALANVAAQGSSALAAVLSSAVSFHANLESAEASHQQRVAQIMRSGGGGGGGGGRVKAADDTNKKIAEVEGNAAKEREKLAADTAKRLTEIALDESKRLAEIAEDEAQTIAKIAADEARALTDIDAGLANERASIRKQSAADIKQIQADTAKQLTDLEAETQRRLAEIDDAAASDRIASQQRLTETIISSMDALRVAQESNDLDLIGADEQKRQELEARETAEAKARIRMQQAVQEATEEAAQGDANLAEDVLAIRQDAIQQQQQLDEKYARRRIELAEDPEALAALEQQYQEATAAIAQEEADRVQFAQAASEARKAAAAAEREAVIADAQAQRDAIIQAAQEQTQEVMARMAEQTTQAIAKAEEQRAAVAQKAEEQRAAAAQKAEEQRSATIEKAEEQTRQAIAKAEEAKQAIIQKAEEQKNEIVKRAQEQGAGSSGAAGQSIAERLRLEEEAYQKELEDQAIAYAQQQAAQKAHLGQMLINWVNTQVDLKQIGSKEAAALTDAIATQYGVRQELSAQTFEQMTEDIMKWAEEGGQDADALAEKLLATGDDALDTQRKMDAMAKEYTATLVQNFRDGKIDAEELRKEIEKIPEEVRTQVEIDVKVKIDEEHRMSEHEGNAFGGPVQAGVPTWVGENRQPELFVPEVDGHIYTRPQAQGWRPPASAAQILSGAASGPNISQTRASTVNLNYLSGPPPPPQQSLAMAKAMAL